MRIKVLRENPVFGYVVALGLFAISLGARFALDVGLSGYPFIAFLPAILLTAVICGVGPGILVGVLSVVAAVYFFIPPYNSFAIPDRNHLVGIGFFVFVIAVILGLVDSLQKKIDALDEANLERDRLVDYQKVLFAELQHRVANNLAFVSSLLALQKRELDRDSPAAKVLDLAGLRVMAISRIHRTLHDQASLNQPLTVFLKQLTTDILNSAGVDNATIDVYGDEVRLDLDRLTTLALLIGELVTNCAKHALLKGLGNKVTLHVERLTDQKIRIEVADNGPGLPPVTQKAPAGERLGKSIILGLVKQLSGEYEVVNSHGTAAIITFPLPSPKA